jgi:hypothetical protein
VALTVSGLNLTVMNACDATSDWSGSPSTDTETYMENGTALAWTLKGSGNNDVTYTLPSGTLDMSGTKHVRFWGLFLQGSKINTFAAGGIQFFASDGTNTGYWYVGGRDTYPGGFYNFVVDVSAAVDAGTKPTAMNAITSWGIRVNLTGTAKNFSNTWIDNVTMCDGLIAYGEHDTGADTGATQTISVVASTGTYTRSAGSYLTDGFKPGMQVVMSGHANAGNNGTKYISTVTATVITVTDITGLVDETGGGNERVQGFFDIDDVWEKDANTTTGLGIGIIRKIGGVYFFTGAIRIGDASGSSDTKFQDKSHVWVFEDRLVNSTLYDIEEVDNGTGTTEFTLGEVSGTGVSARGIEGCTIRVESLDQTPVFTVTATDTDISNFKLYGTTFLGSGAINFPPSGTDKEALNCNFERCGEMDSDTMKLRNCNFISSQSSTLGALKIDNTSFDVRNSNFINCNRAVRFPSGSQGTYNFYDLTFSNSTYDVRNEVTTGNTVTINKNGTSDPSTSEETAGGTTSFVASYPETVTCKNSSGLAVEGVKVRIEKQSDGSLVDEGTTNASGVFSDTYPGAVPLAVKVIVRLKGYKFASALSTITTDGLDVPFTMIHDSAVNLP